MPTRVRNCQERGCWAPCWYPGAGCNRETITLSRPGAEECHISCWLITVGLPDNIRNVHGLPSGTTQANPSPRGTPHPEWDWGEVPGPCFPNFPKVNPERSGHHCSLDNMLGPNLARGEGGRNKNPQNNSPGHLG